MLISYDVKCRYQPVKCRTETPQRLLWLAGLDRTSQHSALCCEKCKWSCLLPHSNLEGLPCLETKHIKHLFRYCLETFLYFVTEFWKSYWLPRFLIFKIILPSLGFYWLEIKKKHSWEPPFFLRTNVNY